MYQVNASSTRPASIRRNKKMSSQNCHEVDAHCDTPSICTALYHCLLKELPHIYTASSRLLMQQLKDKSAFSLLL